MTDRELLVQYAEKGSAEAFAEIVGCYSATVYSTCRRILGEDHAAEDAAQATFLLLMRKARKLPRRVILSGWLFRTAEGVARNALRVRSRRARREREAAAMIEAKAGRSAASLTEVMPLLDAALARLPRPQLEAVVLRYFRGLSRDEAALELSCPVRTLDARLSRALVRLRGYLNLRGVAVPAVALGTLLGQSAVEASPGGLAASIQAACLGKASASAGAVAMAEGFAGAMVWAKVKLAAAIVIGLSVLGAGVPLVKRAIYRAKESEKKPPARATFPPVETLPEIRDLPDPFIMRSGRRVRTREDWARRREEIKALLFHYQFGHMPPPPGNVTAEEFRSRPQLGGKVVRREMRLSMGPQRKLQLTFRIVTPPGKGPFPVIIRNRGTYVARPPTRVPLAEVVKRGYVFVDYFREDLDRDAEDSIGPAQAAYPDHDWASIAVWAWGGMRVIDYLLTLDEVDPKRIAVTGHSRGADAALLIGALDERVALTAPNAGSAFGTACYRFARKRRVERFEHFGYAHWYRPPIRQCALEGSVLRLPFDVHSLKALVAPRALVTINALDDHMIDPLAMQHTNLAAKVVFDWLGAGDRIGMYFREQGDHDQSEEDWLALLDYADLVFFGKAPESGRKFDKPPFPGAEPIFSWKAPEKDQ